MQSAVEKLIPVLVPMRAARLTCAAAGTVLLYDIVITTSDEIRLIWPSKFSLPKFLYFMNRYFPVPCVIVGMYYLGGFREDITTNVCKIVAISQLAGQQIALITATWLLVIRVVAMYGRKRFVAVGLYTLFATTHLTVTVLTLTIILGVWDELLYVHVLGICVASPTHVLGVAYFIPVICETVLVLMQLFHAYRHAKKLGAALRPFTPLLRTLYLDGFAYFVLVVTLRLWSALTFVFANSSYWYLPVYLEFSLISISVSRLVLHLREASETHHAHALSEATSISLVNLATNLTPNGNHKYRPVADRGWDSRPSAAPQYSTLSVQFPAHSSHAYQSEVKQVRLSLSGHLHDAQRHASTGKTDTGALCGGIGDTPCATKAKDTLDHTSIYASGIASWKDDDHSRLDSPRVPD